MSVSISTGGLFPPVVTGSTPLTSPFSTSVPSGDDQGGGFSSVLKSTLNQVSGLQSASEQQVGSLLQGGSADMSKVMISVEKADVAFQLMMQVRNKIVNAYQDIEKMQF